MQARSTYRFRQSLLAVLLCLSLPAGTAAALDSARVRWAVVNGIAVRYVDSGLREDTSPARTLLLVHGYCGAGSHFDKVLPLLLDTGRCIAVDLPGCGGSQKPDHPYCTEYFVDFLDAFCRTLALERVILVGHSMGGQVAVHFAYRFPERVDRLVLLAPEGLAGEEGVWLAVTGLGSLLEAGFERANRSMVEIALRAVIFGDSGAVCPEVVDTFAAQLETPEGIHALSTITRDVIGHDSVDAILPRIGQETLVLWGDEDRLLRPSWAPRFAEMLPRGELHLLKGCGHAIMLERPAETAALIKEFLSR
jgi:abhydrolase domain-containing protein 6